MRARVQHRHAFGTFGLAEHILFQQSGSTVGTDGPSVAELDEQLARFERDDFAVPDEPLIAARAHLPGEFSVQVG